MLDTIFRTPGERKQVESELRELLTEVREERKAAREERNAASEERIALRVQLDQAGTAVAKLVRTNKALDELGTKADAAMAKVEMLANVAASYDERARRLEMLDQRVGELLAQVTAAERASKALNEPDGHIHRHRKALDELGAQTRDAQATLAVLRQESGALEKTQAELRQSSAQLRQAVQGIATVRGEFDGLRQSESELRQEVQGIRDIAREARADAVAAAGAAKEVETKLESLSQLQEFSKDTEKRLASLNAVAEHVSLKAKALETQRHGIEHAIAESARLTQQVWAMEAQVAKLAEGHEQIQRTEQTVARIEQLARGATHELAAATAGQQEFARESARLEGQGRSMLETLRATVERLAVDKEEFAAFDERLKPLSAALSETEARMQAVLAQDESFAAMQQKSATLNKLFSDLRTETEDLAHKQSALDELTDQLGLVEALGKRTAIQQTSLLKSQGDLEGMRVQLAELHKGFGEATRLREGLAQDRSAIEAFAERITSMVGRTPEIESRLDAVLGKMKLLEEGNQAAKRLGETTAALGAELARVSARQELVEKIDQRINGLFTLSTEVERKMTEQVARRAEIESLAHLCQSLGTQVGNAQQQLEGVSAQHVRLLPLAAEVSKLDDALQVSQRALQAMKEDEAAAQEQHTRMVGVIEHGVRQAAETADGLRRVQALGADLQQVASRSEEMMAQLAQVQARQHDALAQVALTDEQLQRAEVMARQLEHRRSLMVHAEKTLLSFESRLGELDRHADGLEKKMKSLADRDALVQAVKAEVDGIRQISSRSKADLQFVAEHRNDVTDLRGKVEGLLERVGDTDSKIALIESWRKKVEEVQASAHAVTSMLGDMQGTLENLSEQRVVIDDVGEKLARLDFTVQEAQNTLSRLDGSAQEAQNTLRTLQREREVAERVATNIKALRARGSVPPA